MRRGLLLSALVGALVLPHSADAQGYPIVNFDEDLGLAQQNLDRFYSQRLPDHAPYLAPTVSWINGAGSTPTACGELSPEKGASEVASYCPTNRVMYLNRGANVGSCGN